jgi:ABC-type sulfate/molybdate transport systems ATPase subunit
MLSARFRKKLRDFELDIELSVQPSEVLVLLGENGSGKSTVLNLLAGLLSPDEGEMLLNGRTLLSSSSGISSPPEERNIGYVFQNYALFPSMTVQENISFGLKMRKIPKDQISRKISLMLGDLGIAHLGNEPVENLSGGQRQRVALARALIIDPHLLLLDEPLTALDRAAKQKIRAELRDQLVNSNQPSILVTHSLNDAMIIGDRVIVLHQGRAIWTGRPDQLQYQSMGLDLSYFRNEEYIEFGAIAID